MSKDKPEISIIIRTKNEEKWINKCLKNIFNQELNQKYEIIILDNQSTDSTLQRIKTYKKIKIIRINNYLPGKVLNQGIKLSNGKLIVMLSAHCIPSDKHWLKELVNEFDDHLVAGVYSRQLPMKFSSNETKRELFITFGQDKKTQIKDSFFHNASSAIKKSIWKKFKFDEKTTNIEDRIWASKVQKKGYKIIYKPESKVFHHHGIHQFPNMSRLNNTVSRMKENFEIDEGQFYSNELNIYSITPFIGELNDKNKYLLKKTISFIKKCKIIKCNYILSDKDEVINYSKKIGFTALFRRSKKDNDLNLSLSEIYFKYLPKFEKKNIFFDLIVSVEVNNSNRNSNYLKKMILNCVENDYESMMPVKQEFSAVWKKENSEYKRVDDGDYASSIKKPLLILKKDFAIITSPKIIRKSSLIGQKNGYFYL